MTTRRRLRRGPLLVAVGLGGVLATPTAVAAHGLVGSTTLPIPSWLFGWAAAIVLIASFIALSTLWPEPRLQTEHRRPLFRLPSLIIGICGLFGGALLVIVVYSGFEGTSVTNANLEPTFIYVHFWVGLVIVSAIFGNIFRAFNPWRAIAIATAYIIGRVRGRPLAAPFAYPEWLGRWPAVVGVLGFGWLELAYADKDVPSTLAALTVAYVAIQLAGMAAFGIESWSERGDAFGSLFALYARLSPLERRDGELYVRRPLSGVPPLPLYAGTVGLLCVVIGTTTFDGFSNGPVWRSAAPPLENFFKALGVGQVPQIELADTVGLLACVALIAGVYRLGIHGMSTVDRRWKPGELAMRFAHTLIPIAFAYALAHYFSLLAYQGQAITYLVSDPLGNGSNLFGTAHSQVNYNIISAAGIWYVQVAALVCGHVAGLILAHDRAVAMYRHVKEAAQSQYWMLVVMVGFTSLGLWLLSAVNA